MTIARDLRLLPALGICLFLAGCGGVPIREQVTPGLQSGSWILGEVVIVVSREELADQSKLPKLREDLLASGVPESELGEGSEVIVWSYGYAHNSSVGWKYGGRYLAHVNPALRDSIKVGSIVAVRVDMNPQNRPLGSVMRVYGDKSDPALGCEYRYLNYEGLAAFSPYGPPIGGWLECKGFAEEGWTRVCVPGAPPPGPLTEHPSCVSELQKPPSGSPGVTGP